MKPREVVKAIVDTSIASCLREAGFRRAGLDFCRRNNAVVQVINIQLSPHNRGIEGVFYVNIALAFDELRAHEARPIVEMPREYECDFRGRLERIVPDAPFWWRIGPEVDAGLLAKSLHDYLCIVLGHLDRAESLSAFLSAAVEHKWLALPGEYDLLARLYDAVENDGAAEECRRLFKEFLHNRETMSPDDFLRHYGFKPVL